MSLPSLTPTLPLPSFLANLFATIDRMDARGYADFFTPEAAWVFGNAAPAVGQDAIALVAQGVFDVLDSIAHDVYAAYQTPTGYIALGNVTYGRRDGKSIVLPFASVYTLTGDKISFYQTFADAAPLFAGYGS